MTSSSNPLSSALVNQMQGQAAATSSGWFASLASNPYFHAGAGIYTLTVAAVLGRYALRIVTYGLKRRFIVSLETTNRDASYEWLMQWMSRHPTFRFQQMSVMTSHVAIHANEETTASTTFAPSPNVTHWLSYKGWPVFVYRKRQVERAAGSDVLETVELSTFGMQAHLMKDIVNEARKQAVDRDSDKTVIYQNQGGRWTRGNEARHRRPLASVLLSGSMRTDVLNDMKVFLSSSDYYHNLGVPYRRGYLLHGPPGCGKSSFVTALAGELRLAICLLSLTNRAVDDEQLNSLLNTAPLRAVILMEDIDRAFTNESRVSMSGLLNALDGVAAQEGRIVFMTTNHVERLDAALIRPGRADLKLEVGFVSSQQAMEFFGKFFPRSSPEERMRFAGAIPDGKLSAAQIQSHLFTHRDSFETAIETAPLFVQSHQQFEVQLEKARERDQKIRNIKPQMLPRDML